MKPRTLLLAGTRKGLFLLRSRDRRRWELQGPFQSGKEVNHAIYDPQRGRLLATANDPWFGSELVWSEDLGRSWQAAKEGPAFPADSGLKLERIWHIAAAPDGRALYAGVAPAALYRSEDGGESWREVAGLSEHPTRPRWEPGAGGLCLHSIALDPADPLRMFVAISAAGVFRTDDGGATWAPRNKGTRAEFRPEKYPEFGQCVHKLLMSPGDSSRLFQQNHCGVYRSDDAGENWQEITSGLPSDFGFPLALHPRDASTLYVIPLQGGEFRCPPEGKLRVFRSRDAGETWEALVDGLPQAGAYCGVYREAMTADRLNPAGVYFGTNTGKLFASRDEGESWSLVADNLPPIYSVSVSALD
jgi:photosystem II stability/assembly factor-like uncharacterized protein